MNRITTEIELRGLLSERQYNDLIKKLKSNEVPFEEDDKDSYFFAREKGVLKINDEISRNRVRLSLKMGDEESGVLREREVFLSRDSLESLMGIFVDLGFDRYHKVPQKRINFFLNDQDVELSLKFTPDFQYHFEIEYIGNYIKDEMEIRAHLEEVCRNLGISPMAPAELAAKIDEIKMRLGFM